MMLATIAVDFGRARILSGLNNSGYGESVSLAKSKNASKLRCVYKSELDHFMRDYSASEDEDLVRASLDGNLNAFDEVVRRHQSMITRCLYRFCPYQADLEDLVQETFVKAFRKLESWQATAPFENWLRKIAYNTGYDYFRKNSRNPASISVNHSEETDYVLETLSEGIDQRRSYEMTEQAQKVLALLQSEDRLLLTLQYLEELPLAEIAAQMGWGLSKTKVKSFRARKKLKKLLINNGIAQETDQSHLG
ncbi:MAG: sigma-70 family RNA polymerase sigma factor [Verrucomicrobia bacterium TMED71]|nr:MAG: sigma-70 family RNA polymerase sigma factor [Verrucomicrobia bacterium TMED71]